MFNFGFSYVGLIYLIMLFVPNIIWTRHKPEGYENYVKNENKFLLVFERAGQVLTTVCILIFSDFNIRKTYWVIFLIISFIFMLLYEVNWIKYFKGRHTMQDMYGSFIGIPVAIATFPVIAFGLLAIYGSNAFLLISVIILGVGHIGICLNHRKEVMPLKKKSVGLRIVRWVFAVIGLVLLALTLVVILGRNINYFSHYRLIQNGVDKEEYINLEGEQQYILTRGVDRENPVIIYLHGGPASPDTGATYGFTDYLVDDYTIIAWNQRGCGRTYYANEATDPLNETASFEQAVADLDALVDYARNEYGKDKVIIMGHSYGTELGTAYVQEHPEKVSAYVGIAQVINGSQDIYSYEDALEKAKAAGDDTTELENAYNKLLSESNVENILALRALTDVYHPVEVADRSTIMGIFSPYYGVDDIRWLLKQLGGYDEFEKLNNKLYDYTKNFDIYNQPLEYDVPVYLVSGSCDWTCPTGLIEEYYENISAPDKAFEIIEGPGHLLQFSLPEEFAETVKELLK